MTGFTSKEYTKRRDGGHRLAVILAIGFAVRLISWPAVMTEPEISWVGGTDAYYHLYRARQAADGCIADHDPMTNYPDGDAVHWPKLYGKILGFILRVFGESGLIWVGPIVGILAILIASSVFRKIFPETWFYPAVAFVLFPVTIYPTSLGFLDHHGLEVLFAAAIATLPSSRARWPAAAFIIFLAANFTTTAPIPAMIFLLAEALRSVRGKSATAIVFFAGAITMPALGASYLTDPWMPEATEANPAVQSGQDFLRIILYLSPGIFFLPQTLLSSIQKRQFLIVALITVAGPLTIIQGRFMPWMALPCAIALEYGRRWIAERTGSRIGLLVAFILLIPSLRGVGDVYRWMETSDPDAASLAAIRELRNGEGPVVASWEYGHGILALSGKPVFANAFHTSVSGRRIADSILFSAPVTGTSFADSYTARTLLLTDMIRQGYGIRHRADSTIPIAESLYGQLYLFQREDLGWKRTYSSGELFEWDGFRVPLIQIWERDLPR